MSNTNHRSSRASFFHLIVLYLVWGSTFLGMRIAVNSQTGFPPFMLATLRLGLAGCILLGLGRLRRHSVRVAPGDILPLIVTGSFLWVGGHAWIVWAAQHADSGFAALLFGSMPLWAALLGVILHGKTINRGEALSLNLGFSGIVFLSFNSLSGGDMSGEAILSLIVLFVAPISWALGSMCFASRIKKVPSLVAAGYQQLFAAVICFIWSVSCGEHVQNPSPSSWLALAYLTLFGSVLASFSFASALRTLPHSLAMSFAYVNPVVAIFLGWFFLNEVVTSSMLWGAALIVLSIMFMLYAERPASISKSTTLETEI